MSQTLLKRKRRLSPFDALYQDPYDEDAWYEIFGERLSTRICTVVIRETGVIRIKRSRNYYQRNFEYRRQNLAYC